MAMLRAVKTTFLPQISSLISTARSVSTLVVAEHEGGAIKGPSVSAVEAAKALGDGNSISILVAGSGPSLQEAAAHAASCHPSISQVLVADSDKCTHSLAEPWARLVHLVQQKGGYSHILAAANSFGKNILPRAAALLDVSPITDVIDISGSSQFVRPIYAGNALCTVRYTGASPCMLTIRSTSFPVPAISADTKSNEARISQVDLSTFGEVGATRAAVDAGFVPNDLQVGQTGKIVAPELYMAFGVSGAIQHIAGMRDSRVIVAVNKDSDAPVFQVADYGLVGDLFEVIPELLEKLPEKK
ncbi:electron transfer flavoprotein subunit alpha, mitochondrial isoform X3 [Hevea brasiliensis]|uniref:electron transfer flavoprotein subunit alpha, mitochondrial isoform X3 n=1 Tax=Hevea brasiliensis TaxID=3981 RepID=UPI0025CDCDD1|nr:electron transfer flavoprotein subunit alpha, mitochondrial isoform X3 [Hevea brasiliensis]